MKEVFHKVVAEVVEAHEVAYAADDAEVVVLFESESQLLVEYDIGVDKCLVAMKVYIVTLVVPTYMAF